MPSGQRLLRRYFESIHRFFASKLDEDVEDLVQNTFLGCIASRDRFQKKSSFRTYLYSIARRQLYRHLRDRYADDRHVDFGVTSVADLTTSARTRLARDQQRTVLARALSQLPVRHQLLLELYYWEDMNTAQLAEVFEVSRSTVSTWLFRSREKLREQLTRNARALRLDDGIDGLDAWARELKNKPAVRKRSEVAERLRHRRTSSVCLS